LIPFDKVKRVNKSYGYKFGENSSDKSKVNINLWGKNVSLYGNVNFSIYSAQKCNADCTFCVEELRPASRGVQLANQKRILQSDSAYFEALYESLEAVRLAKPTISITGGEPSKDRRLEEILSITSKFEAPRITITTNASGLLDKVNNKMVLDTIINGKCNHINISRAHYSDIWNNRLMRYSEGPTIKELKYIVAKSKEAGVRVRLSCVLIDGAIDTVDKIIKYLKFSEYIGVDNVIFRQLMKIDKQKFASNYVVLFTEAKRTNLDSILHEIEKNKDMNFQSQIVGYYYYVEVWKYKNIDVVFEEADLAQLEKSKQEYPNLIHELVFHPNGKLCSTWQPWDGILGPNIQVN